MFCMSDKGKGMNCEVCSGGENGAPRGGLFIWRGWNNMK